MQALTNLTSHLLQQTKHHEYQHRLTDVINRIALASKILSRDITHNGLLNISGSAGSTNVQDEDQQKLDVIANDICIALLKQSPYVAAIGTEEAADLIRFEDPEHQSAEYIVYIDPVDGSSNIAVNVSIGTNFLIFRRKSPLGTPLEPTDYLQRGSEAVAAGYIVYGASTMFVYTVGNGVDGFTLDTSLGEYILTHPQITIPQQTSIISVNAANEPVWSAATQKLVTSITQKSGMTARYIGSLVADYHRNMLIGGLFMYPADQKKPEGKLRLLYEAIPFAFLAEQSGGAASNGQRRIVSITPKHIHERTPLYIGTQTMMGEIEDHFSS